MTFEKSLLMILISVLIFCQVLLVLVLIDGCENKKRIYQMEEQAAMMKNEAEALNLRMERMRYKYYKDVLKIMVEE